jgi:rhomboid protease GluP
MTATETNVDAHAMTTIEASHAASGAAVASPPALSAEFTGAPAKTFPVVTSIILTAMALLFLSELLWGVEPDRGAFKPSVATLLAFGGLQYQLTVAGGQWYRLFSAPLLHLDLVHVVINGIVLWYAGRVLEAMIGRLWFASVFIIGGLAGGALSLAVNAHNIVSVGASGAIMAVLSATLVLAFHFDAGTERSDMQGNALRLLIPSLIPVGFAASKIDFGAHFGGAIGGAIIAALLLAIWSRYDTLPALRRVAMAIVALGLIATCYSASANANGYRTFGLKRLLIPAADIPKDDATMYAKSVELLKKYPRDPRARHYAAMSLVKAKDLAGAEQHMRAGLAEEDILRVMLVPTAKPYFQSYLSLILYDENRKDEAKEFAKAACLSPSPALVSTRARLIKFGLCETPKS